MGSRAPLLEPRPDPRQESGHTVAQPPLRQGNFSTLPPSSAFPGSTRPRGPVAQDGVLPTHKHPALRVLDSSLGNADPVHPVQMSTTQLTQRDPRSEAKEEEVASHDGRARNFTYVFTKRYDPISYLTSRNLSSDRRVKGIENNRNNGVSREKH